LFGYILPDKPEMKIKEFELFRAYYCGICKSMGRNSGFGARMSLNYDAVFLGLFLSSLTETTNEIKREGCIANPLKKKPVVKNSPALDFAADINTLLTYYKLLDDIRDEKSMKAAAVYPLFAGARKKALHRFPDADEIIKKSMEKQSQLERSGESSVDAAAEPFAKLLGNLFVLGYRKLVAEPQDGVLRSLDWIGYNIGKWIYTLDAYDDIGKDLGSGSYNPFVENYRKKGAEPGDEKERIPLESREMTVFILESCLGQIAKAFELLKLRNAPILENIIYLGMNKKVHEIVYKKCKEGSCK